MRTNSSRIHERHCARINACQGVGAAPDRPHHPAQRFYQSGDQREHVQKGRADPGHARAPSRAGRGRGRHEHHGLSGGGEFLSRNNTARLTHRV